MKQLLVIALVLFTLNGTAQERSKENHSNRKQKMEMLKSMTPKEIADLKTKRLTLHLDLSDKQQKDVHKLILTQTQENRKFRNTNKRTDEARKEKLSKEEFLKMQNHRLDQQIAFKRDMKTILTPEQYKKFEKMKLRKHRKKRKRKRRQ